MQKKLTLIFVSIFQISILSAQRKPIVIKPDFDVTDPANRTLYEQYIESHPFATRPHYNKTEIKQMPKADRPDLAWEQDFLRTMDPALGRPAPERLIDAYEIVEQYQANQMGIPGSASIPWVERGPNNVGGRTRAIVFDPNDVLHKKVWAGGVTGGLWYNTDITNASSQWIAVNDFWDNLAITAIAFDPNNSQIIYVGTGEGFGTGSSRGAGVWKSTNGGSSFSQLSATSDYYYVNDLVVRNESGSSVLYVGVSEMYYQGAYQGTATYYQGMFRSTNGGTSFTQVMPNTGTAGSYYAPVDIEIAANNRLWVGTRRNSYGAGGGVIMYSDNGTSWTIATNRGTNARVEIACAPSSANTIYAVVEASGTVEEIIKTTNGGTSWVSSSTSTAITEPADADNGIPNGDFTRGQAWYDLVCEVDPTNANTLYVGGIDLFRSSNAGLTWTQISKWSNNNNLAALSCPLVHADQHAFVFRPGANNEAVIGNDGGVYYASTLSGASSNGAAISHRVSNYNVTQFYACAMSPTANSNVFLAGAQDNGTQRYTNVGVNATTQVNGGDGAYCFIDQTNANQAIASYVYNSYYYSSNGGSSFGTTLLADQNTGSFINPADYDDNMNILYSCKDVNSIYRVSGVGTSPSTATVSISGMTARATNIKVSPFTTTSTKLFIGTSGGSLYRVTNANIGTSPTVANITGSSFPNASISSIEFGANENTIIVTFFNYGVTNVWYTTNGGSTWASKEGNLPDMPVRWAMMSPTSANEVILATEVGVWSTTNFQSTSPTWVPSNTGLANVRVDMLQMRASDSEVLAATYGRGLFSSSYLSSVCSYPTALGASNVGASSADISWTAGASETSWNIQYGLSGFSLGSGSTATSSSTSYSLSSLQTGYSYDFYVQANCGGGTVSAWAGPYSFTTVCGPITSFPYTMDFENGSPCWTILNGGDPNTWQVTSGQGIGGGYCANIEYSSTAHDDHLISPQFTVTNGTSNQIRFSAKNYNSLYPENFSVLVSTSGNSAANFTDTIALNIFPTTSVYTEYSYDLSAYNGQAIYVSIYSNTTDEWFLFIDNFIIDAPCAVYNSLSVSACDSYTWSATGFNYASSGLYYDTLIAASGCDSILTLNLTINSSSSGSENVSACNSYTWPANGQTYATSGSYSATVTNASGCDSVLTLNLTISTSLSSTETATACNSYLWSVNNQAYTATGAYSVTLTTSGGCDSVVTLNLTINSSSSGSENVSACNSYTWPANGQTYAASGSYTATVTNALGCDSVATLNLIIGTGSASNVNVSACDSYTWPANGQTYTSSGNYTATLTNAVGCDSIITLNLGINTSSASADNVTSCTAYTWPATGLTYTASGAYTTTLTNASGCDSVLTLNLTISTSLSSTETATACNSYLWSVNNQTYTATGAYSVTLTTSGGCDSVVTLNLTINSSSSGSENVSACNSYTWPANGQTYAASGSYTATVTNALGCDSVATLNLIIGTGSASNVNVSACDSYTWPANGQTYTSSGNYTATLTNAVGCDSIITLNLGINTSSASADNVTSCTAYTWPATGLTYTASGAYTTTLTNALGCDSVLTLNLTISTSLSSTETATACNSYLWSVNNQTYTATGAYSVTLTTSGGCDSVVTLNLTINSSSSGSENVSACNSYTWPANGQTYAASGSYTATVTNALGCDSVATLNLIIGTGSASNVNVSACDSYTWPANGQTYTSSGNYTATLTNAVGCDSIITLNLGINTSSASADNVTSCTAYTWPATGLTYTASGAYTTTLTNALGCDSVLTLNLTISTSLSSTETATACNSYLWSVNNQTYTATGSYSQVFANQYGCDSTITLNLTIHNNTIGAVAIMACDSFISPSGNIVWYSSGTYVDTLVNSNSCDSILTVDLTINNSQNSLQTVLFCNSGPQFTAGGQAITAIGQYVDVLTASTGCDSIITTIVAADTQLPNVVTQNVTAYLDLSGNATITASQVDNGSTDNCGIAAMTLNQNVFTCADLGTNTVILTVVDESGNSNAAIAAVTILDTISPQIILQPDTLYLNQAGQATVSFALIDAGSTDNCGIASSFVFPNVFHCAHANTFQTVYCSVTDSAGNNAASNIQVYIADTLAPMIESDSGIAYLDANGAVVLSPMDVSSVSDNCVLDSVWLVNSSFSCNEVNTYQNVNVFAQDANGNIAQKQVFILIKDTIAPTIAANTATVQLNASGNGALSIATVDAGSFDNCAITSQTLSKTAFNCSDQGWNEVLYTVQDISGNSSSILVSVNVVDNVNTISGFTSSSAAPTYTNVNYSVNPLPNATYDWSVTNGVLNSQSGSSAVVTWYYYSQGTIQVIQTTENGCSDTLVKNIALWPLGDIAIETNEIQFELYPNPSQGDINLVMTQGEVASKLVDLSVYDVAGNAVLIENNVRLNIGEVHSIETHQMAKGLYILKLENQDGSHIVRFILQ